MATAQAGPASPLRRRIVEPCGGSRVIACPRFYLSMISPTSTSTKVAEYIASVMDGRIAAGSLVKATIQRHLGDLDREHDVDFLYEFDPRSADFACRFFPAVLCHSIGEWAGHPFELSDWQLFIVWCLFGWKRKSDGYRRFRKAYISVARKNGKSTLCAGLALLLMAFDQEQGAQVFVGATKHEQACIIHGEAVRMVRSSPSLRKHCDIHKDNISCRATNSFFRPCSSDKPHDGWGPHGVFFDELHAYRELHRPFYETMTTGSAHRTQPLAITITTAGDDKSLLWKEEDRFVGDVCRGDIEDATVFGYIATIDSDDDPFDESCWEKANPNIGLSVKVDYLRQQAAEAKHKPTAANAFVRYHCNRQVSSVEDAFSAATWDAAAGELSDWRHADYIGAGIDLGGRDDLAAYALCARFIDGFSDDGMPRFRYELRSSAFIESDTSRDISRQPWQQWLYRGKLRQTPQVIADLRDALIADCDDLGVSSVAFDPHNARQLGQELDEYGITANMMPQNHGKFNEPLKQFESALNDRRIRHSGQDEVMRWCVLNMAISRNARDEWMPDKKHSKDKIDVIVAAIMAFREAYFAPYVPQGPMFVSA